MGGPQILSRSFILRQYLKIATVACLLFAVEASFVWAWRGAEGWPSHQIRHISSEHYHLIILNPKLPRIAFFMGQSVGPTSPCSSLNGVKLTQKSFQPSLDLIYHWLQDDRSKSWRVQAVAVSPDSFESRKPLPLPWRGLRDDELSRQSGIPGCVFVHMSGFIGGNQSYDGALTMARAALKLWSQRSHSRNESFAQNGRCSPCDFPDLLNCHLHTFWTKISTVLWGNSVIITRLWLKVLQEQPRADPSAVLVRITRVPLNTCLELQVSLVDGLIGFINPKKKKNKEERKLVYSGRMEPRIHSSATVGRSSLNHV